MKIFLASDHAGFALKNMLMEWLQSLGHEIEDVGPFELNPSDDYPHFILPLARLVAKERGSRGVICGMSGQGEAMAANRVRGARAAVYYGGTKEILMLTREDNDSNILSLSAKFVSVEEAKDAVSLWLSTEFSGEQRHQRRIKELDA